MIWQKRSENSEICLGNRCEQNEIFVLTEITKKYGLRKMKLEFVLKKELKPKKFAKAFSGSKKKVRKMASEPTNLYTTSRFINDQRS